MTALPRFTEHDEHSKLVPLSEPKPLKPVVAAWLERVTGLRRRSRVRVLDVGYGRGGTVAWLVEQGWDAYGFDVDPRYVANGEAYLTERGEGGRLAVLDGSTLPYPDASFDVVLSDQVMEHVADLESLARELARVTRTGGSALHVFPAKWILREPHMLAPAVHWVPKGRLRRSAIRTALRTGRAAPYFADRSLDERTEIFAEYSENETFYRSPREIARTMRDAGFDVDMKTVAAERAQEAVGRHLVWPLRPVAGWAYRSTRVMYLETNRGLPDRERRRT